MSSRPSSLLLPGPGMEDDPTVFTTHSLPKDPRLLATVTNSYLGTQVYHRILHVSGVYNGARGDTHRADLPSPLNVHLMVPACQRASIEETFALDTKTGRGPPLIIMCLAGSSLTSPWPLCLPSPEPRTLAPTSDKSPCLCLPQFTHL